MEQLKITSLEALSLRFAQGVRFPVHPVLENTAHKVNANKHKAIINCRPIS